jgi:hypothetical protein
VPQQGWRHRKRRSVRSVVAGGGNLQYDTTKAAVAGLTRALAADHSAGQQEPVPIALFHRLEQHLALVDADADRAEGTAALDAF